MNCPFPNSGEGVFYRIMFNELIVRVGTFSILLGVGILMLFIASDGSGRTNFDFLFWAVLSITLGILLRRQKEPAPPSERFALLRRLRNKDKDHKEER